MGRGAQGVLRDRSARGSHAGARMGGLPEEGWSGRRRPHHNPPLSKQTAAGIGIYSCWVAARFQLSSAFTIECGGTCCWSSTASSAPHTTHFYRGQERVWTITLGGLQCWRSGDSLIGNHGGSIASRQSITGHVRCACSRVTTCVRSHGGTSTPSPPACEQGLF